MKIVVPLVFPIVTMASAAPEGTPPRRIRNEKIPEYFPAPPCPGGALRRGALI